MYEKQQNPRCDFPPRRPVKCCRRVTYSLSAKGTPYVVVSGIYDDKATINELSKLTDQK